MKRPLYSVQLFPQKLEDVKRRLSEIQVQTLDDRLNPLSVLKLILDEYDYLIVSVAYSDGNSKIIGLTEIVKFLLLSLQKSQSSLTDLQTRMHEINSKISEMSPPTDGDTKQQQEHNSSQLVEDNRRLKVDQERFAKELGAQSEEHFKIARSIDEINSERHRAKFRIYGYHMLTYIEKLVIILAKIASALMAGKLADLVYQQVVRDYMTRYSFATITIIAFSIENIVLDPYIEEWQRAQARQLCRNITASLNDQIERLIPLARQLSKFEKDNIK